MTTGTGMSERPRSRRQTRVAILGELLQSGGIFRRALAKAGRLCEVSPSHTLSDLKAEGLIAEVRRPALYFSGPTALMSLDDSVALGAIERTGQRLSVGVASMSGQSHGSARSLFPTPTAESASQVFHSALALPRHWTRRHHVELSQIDICATGLGRPELP